VTEPVLQADGLVKRFGEATAVDRLSLAVAEGEVFGLVGPDGAGKTTTLRMLCGLTLPDAGTVRLLGLPMPESRRKARARMGYMPQQYSLYGDLSVQENLRFFAGMYGVPKATLIEREKRLLGIARLDRFRDRPARALSGGMYKKLALACALAHSPRLLLLDEPTNGVDPISRRELWAFLYELVGEGVSVLVSTPYMDEAERCGRVGLLLDGRLVAVDRPAALKAGFAETVFELDTAPLYERSILIESHPDVRDVYLVGRKAHVVTARGQEFASDLSALFATAGYEIRRLDVVAPSFEDVFLRLTASGGGAPGGEA